MQLLQRTHDEFRDGVRIKVVRVESVTTIWVRLLGWPTLTQTMHFELMQNPTKYMPKENSLKPGTLVAVLVNTGTTNYWDRAIIVQQTGEGYTVFLIDWGIESYKSLSTIRFLPPKYASMPPWAKKIRLLGVRDQAEVAVKHHVAQVKMMTLTGCLTDINLSPAGEMTARLMLDWEPGQPPKDMGEHWLKLGYVDPE